MASFKYMDSLYHNYLIESFLGIDMDEFVDRFKDNYEYLYAGGDRREDYDALVEEGDNLLERLSVDEPEFMKELYSHRGDALSSDRELVAFLLTWNEFNGIKLGENWRGISESIKSLSLTEDYGTAIFNTKFSKNKNRNGQRVSIIDTNDKSIEDLGKGKQWLNPADWDYLMKNIKG